MSQANNFLDGKTKSSEIDSFLGPDTPPASAARKLGDLGLSLAKGVVAVPEAAVGLADLVTGGRAGKAAEDVGIRFKDAKDVLSGFQSDDYKAKQAEFQKADGLLNKAGVAITNPSLVANTVVESLPLMGVGGVGARGIMSVAPKVGAVGAGALGEGIAGAGSAAEQIRQETPDGLMTGKQAALAGASGLATAAFGAAGGKMASKLGIGDVDTMIARGATDVAQTAAQANKGMIRRGAEGFLSEGVLEELPQSLSEQILQNEALGKPWQEGLDEAAVMAVLSGGTMGAGAGVMTGRQAQPVSPPPVTPPGPNLSLDPNTQLAAVQSEEMGAPNVAQTTPPDGRAVLAAQQEQQRQQREAQLAAQRAVTSPDDEILASTGVMNAVTPQQQTAAAILATVPVDQTGAPNPGILARTALASLEIPADPIAPAATAESATELTTTEQPYSEIQPGDILTKITNRPFTKMETAMSALARAGEGHEIVRVKDGLVIRPTGAQQSILPESQNASGNDGSGVQPLDSTSVPNERPVSTGRMGDGASDGGGSGADAAPVQSGVVGQSGESAGGVDAAPVDRFDVTHAGTAAIADPKNADVVSAYNQTQFAKNPDGSTRRVGRDHFESWVSSGGVSSDVGSQYDGHGIAKGNPLGALLNILTNGINTSRRFDSAPLTPASSAAGAGSGLGSANGAYKDGPFILLGERGKSILDGIKTVLVSDEVAASIPALQQRFPDVRFVSHSNAQAVLSQDANVQNNQAPANEPKAQATPDQAPQAVADNENSTREASSIATSGYDTEKKIRFATFAESLAGQDAKTIQAALAKSEFGQALAVNELEQVSKAIAANAPVVADQARKNAAPQKESTPEQKLKNQLVFAQERVKIAEKAVSDAVDTDKFGFPAADGPKKQAAIKRHEAAKKTLVDLESQLGALNTNVQNNTPAANEPKAEAAPDAQAQAVGANTNAAEPAPGTGTAKVEANGVAPKQGPGAPLANGFFAGPVEGEKFRVSDVSATGGLTLDKRLSGGTVSTMYVGADGGFVDAENVNMIGDGVARLWKPLTDLARQAAREILQEMGALPLGNKRREELKAKLKEVVANDGKPPAIKAPSTTADSDSGNEVSQSAQPGLPGEGAGVSPAEDKKAKWLKAINDQNRLMPVGGVQLTVQNGKLTFMGNPDSSKQGKALQATLAEAQKAGASIAEIIASIQAPEPKKTLANTIAKRKQPVSQSTESTNEKAAQAQPQQTQPEAGPTASIPEPAAVAGVEGAGEVKPAKKPNKLKQAAQDLAAARAYYFTPGNIVKSYGGHDEVLSYATNDNGGFTVKVHAVRNVGGQWVRQGKPQDARTHSTQPDARELKQGPVTRLGHQPAGEVVYSEPRADGKPFPNAVDRGVKPVIEAPTAKPEVVADQPSSLETASSESEAKTETKPPQAPANTAQPATESVAKPREAIEHAGVKIYPITFKGEPHWSVQSEDNRTNGKVLGDTIHATLEGAKQSAEEQVRRVKSKQERNAAYEAEQAAAQAKKDANKGKSLADRKRDFDLDKPTKLPVQDGLGTGTRRESMQKAVDQDRHIASVMVEDTAAKKKDKATLELVRARGYILGASNENIPLVKQGLEAQARLKANKYEKPEYRVYSGRDDSGSFYEISKTEYDYAQELKEKQATRETITPADDKNIGVNLDGNQLYERKDGSVYQMQDGKPRFSGFLEPVSASKEAVAPANTAQPATETIAKPAQTVESVARAVQQKIAANRRKAREKSRKEYEAKGWKPNSTPESEQADYDTEVNAKLSEYSERNAAALLGDNPLPLIEMFVNGNFEASEDVFKDITGVKIRGLSVADKKAALYKWANWTPEQIAKAEADDQARIDKRAEKQKQEDAKTRVMGEWAALLNLNIGEPGTKGIDGQEFVLQAVAKGYDKAHSQKKGVATIYGLTNGKEFTTLKKGAFTDFVKAAIAFGGLDKTLEYVNPPMPQKPAGFVDRSIETGKDAGMIAKAFAPTESETKPTSALAEPAPVAIENVASEPSLPDNWRSGTNQATNRPTLSYNPQSGAHWATVHNVIGNAYEIEYRKGQSVVESVEVTGSRNDVIRQVQERVAELSGTPIHQDPGKAPEAATAPVIAQSLAKAARKEDHTQKEMRLWLVGEIDKAVKLTEDYADYQESIKKNGQDIADSVFYGKANGSVGLTTPQGNGTITFDVPGDGKFKIRNSLRGLMEFRAKVEAKSGTGFTDKTTKAKGLPASTGVAKGSSNQIEALSSMLEELDFEAAVDYARETGTSLDAVKISPEVRKQFEAYLKDGTEPQQFSPSRYWEYPGIDGADKDGNPIRRATLTKQIGASEYVALVVGTNATGFKYNITKDGKSVHAMLTSNSFANALKLAEDAINAIQPEVVKPKDTGWNMAGVGFAGKRYRGRNITLDDGREVVARIYENAGQYEDAEVKVDGVSKFRKTDRYKAEKLADDFIRTLTAKEAAPENDRMGFTKKATRDDGFTLTDGNMLVTVESTSYGFQASHGSSAKSGPRLTEQQAIEWAANIRDESKKIQKQESKSEPDKEFRNPDTLNVLRNPIEDKDWFKLKNGEEWQARQGYSGRGWSLVRNGNLHPEARNFESQSDFIRSVIEVTGQTQAAGEVVAPVEADDETIPAVTEAQARKQFEWRNMGQKDGTKSHLLFFFESEKDKGTGAAMNRGEVSLYPGASGWKVEDGDGTSYKSLADAKKAAIDRAIPILQDQGYILKPAQAATAILDAANVTGKERIDALKDVKKGDVTPEELQAAYPAAAGKFEQHNTIANEYGYAITDDGSISLSEGKESGLKVVLKGSRFQIRNKTTDDLIYSGATVDSMGKFLESFWGAEKTPTKPDNSVKPEAGGMQFSRSNTQNTGLTPTQFTAELAKAFGAKVAERLQEKGVVVPLADQSKLPAHVVPFLRDGDIIYGFYDPKTDRTYAVLENLTPEMVKGLVLHEVGVHFGFEAMLGEAKYTSVMNRLDFMRRAGNKAVKEAYAEAQKNSVRDSQVPEETLAYLVQTQPEMGIIKEIIARIKAFLFSEFGIGGKYLTEADLTMLARAAVDHSSRMEDGGSVVPAFMRGTNGAVTNQKDVVGNQGGRSADDTAPGVLFTDENDNAIVYEREGFRISVNRPGAASYVVLWAKQEVNGKTYWRKAGTLDTNQKTKKVGGVVGEYLGVSSIEIEKAYRAQGLGLEMYRALMANAAPNIAGVISHTPNRVNKQQVPRIYRKLGAFTDGDNQIIPIGRNEPTAPDSGGAFARKVDQTGAEANPDIRFSRTIGATLASAANSTRDLAASTGMGRVANMAVDALNDRLSYEGTVGIWHKTFGSMYHLAKSHPPFQRVFNAAQDFINDVSYYASEAADLAPKLLPKLEDWKDIGKQPISAADNKAIQAPIFEGTLSWARDEAGKPVRVDDLTTAAQELTAEQKAQRLLRGDHISESVLKMWQGLPVDQFESIIEGKFESSMLRPGVVWTPAELKSMFNLTGEKQPNGTYDGQIGLYQEFRNATDNSLDNTAKVEMLRYAGEPAEGLRELVLDAPDADTAAVLLRDHLLGVAEDNPEQSESLTETANGVMDQADRVNKLKAEGYAPLSRFGQYSVDVVVDGKREYFDLFETKEAANQMAGKMRMEFGAANVETGTMSAKEFQLFQGMTPESMELFGNMLGLDAGGEKASDTVFQTYLRFTKNNRSAMKRLMHRKGIAGFSTDTGRVLASFIYSNARLTSSGLHMGTLDKAVQDIPKTQGQLKDAAIELREYIKNPREEAQAMRGLLFAQYLGGNVASMMMNFMQVPTVSLPYLSQYGGIKKATAALLKAMKDQKSNMLEKGLQQALKDADEKGITQPQAVHELMAQSRGAATLKSGDGTKSGDAKAIASNALSKFSMGWGKLFGMAEQINRRSTFIAAYRLGVEQGIANPAAFAENAVNETQFINNKANKAKFARGAIGGTLMTFKSYSTNYLELLYRLATKKDANGKPDPEGKKAALLMLGMLFLMAGAGGMPGAEDTEDLIDGIAQRMGYNLSTKKSKEKFFEDIFGKAIGGFMMSGLSGLPGSPIDISGRGGMGNLWPGTGIFMPKASHANDLLEFGGPAAGMLKRFGEAAGHLSTGNVFEAAMSASPVAIANMRKGVDMLDSGMYKDAKGYKVMETTPGEAFAKIAGFQPKSVKDDSENSYLRLRTENFYNSYKQSMTARWANGLFENDPKQVQEAKDMIASWNEKNPELPMRVNMMAVAQRFRHMRETREERILKSSPKVMQSTIRKEMEEARAAR